MFKYLCSTTCALKFVIDKVMFVKKLMALLEDAFMEYQ